MRRTPSSTLKTNGNIPRFELGEEVLSDEAFREKMPEEVDSELFLAELDSVLQGFLRSLDQKSLIPEVLQKANDAVETLKRAMRDVDLPLSISQTSGAGVLEAESTVNFSVSCADSEGFLKTLKDPIARLDEINHALEVIRVLEERIRRFNLKVINAESTNSPHCPKVARAPEKHKEAAEAASRKEADEKRIQITANIKKWKDQIREINSSVSKIILSITKCEDPPKSLARHEKPKSVSLLLSDALNGAVRSGSYRVNRPCVEKERQREGLASALKTRKRILLCSAGLSLVAAIAPPAFIWAKKHDLENRFDALVDEAAKKMPTSEMKRGDLIDLLALGKGDIGLQRKKLKVLLNIDSSNAPLSSEDVRRIVDAQDDRQLFEAGMSVLPLEIHPHTESSINVMIEGDFGLEFHISPVVNAVYGDVTFGMQKVIPSKDAPYKREELCGEDEGFLDRNIRAMAYVNAFQQKDWVLPVSNDKIRSLCPTVESGIRKHIKGKVETESFVALARGTEGLQFGLGGDIRRGFAFLYDADDAHLEGGFQYISYSDLCRRGKDEKAYTVVIDGAKQPTSVSVGLGERFAFSDCPVLERVVEDGKKITSISAEKAIHPEAFEIIKDKLVKFLLERGQDTVWIASCDSISALEGGLVNALREKSFSVEASGDGRTLSISPLIKESIELIYQGIEMRLRIHVKGVRTVSLDKEEALTEILNINKEGLCMLNFSVANETLDKLSGSVDMSAFCP